MDDIIKFLSESKKQTIVKAYLQTDELIESNTLQIFKSNSLYFILGELKDIEEIILKKNISKYYIEIDKLNSAVKLLDYKLVNARIEPGAIIRDRVKIGDNSIIMMGAVINIGSIIGSETMIDMNAVVGGKVKIGNRCHIGACSVLAGVIEPASSVNVVIEDDVVIGANCTILEGIRIKKGAVIAAGSVVINDVGENEVYAGVPAKKIKVKDKNTISKTEIIDSLRTL